MDNPAKAMWEDRYGADAYVYGLEPNDFVRASVADLPPGDALCFADGEGRNGVHLAELGHRVTSVDLSENGLAKARKLALDRGVTIETVVADLADFDLGTGRWDLIVSIWAHTPPPVRRRLHEAVATALRPSGLFVLEAYTPDQIGRGTGGPPDAALTMTLAGLREELVGMTITHGVERDRSVVEGAGHTGEAAVVQVLASPAAGA
ncbi:MAG: class I SAM-dependent methyltransferase [Acidimicrobiales bacterium]